MAGCDAGAVLLGLLFAFVFGIAIGGCLCYALAIGWQKFNFHIRNQYTKFLLRMVKDSLKKEKKLKKEIKEDKKYKFEE